MHTKVPAPSRTLLKHYRLLLRIYSALGILCGDRDYALAIGQRGCEVVKRSVGQNQRYFMTIDHDPRAGLGFAHHLDDVSVLDEGIQLQPHAH